MPTTTAPSAGATTVNSAIAIGPHGKILMIHWVTRTGAVPLDATKYSGSRPTCQYLTSKNGHGRDLTSWWSDTNQFPSDGEVCNPSAAWEETSPQSRIIDGPFTLQGCFRAPANGEIYWYTDSISYNAPVNMDVKICWSPFGCTSSAYVYN
jgi:hypothetical protein